MKKILGAALAGAILLVPTVAVSMPAANDVCTGACVQSYKSGKTYAKGVVVQYRGDLYVALKKTSTKPTTSKWAILPTAGVGGSDGPGVVTGPAGPAGPAGGPSRSVSASGTSFLIDDGTATGSPTLSLPSGTWKVDWFAISRNNASGTPRINCVSAGSGINRLRAETTYTAPSAYAMLASTAIVTGPVDVRVTCEMLDVDGGVDVSARAFIADSRLVAVEVLP